MNLKIIPSAVFGTLTAISSKSYAHRLLIAAACVPDVTPATPLTIHLNIMSADIAATFNALVALGAHIVERRVGDAITLTITAPINGVSSATDIQASPRKPIIIDCHESGSTARFILPLAAVACRAAGETASAAVLTGRGKLPERPFAALCTALRANGCLIRSDGDEQNSGDFLPLRVSGVLRSGTFALAGDVSSQFLSGLLLALPLLDGDSEIILTTPLQSAGYVEMTREILAEFNLEILAIDNDALPAAPRKYYLKGRQVYRPTMREFIVAGDWSNGAYLLCMGAVGGAVTLRGLDLNSRQGDAQIIEILRVLGATITLGVDAITVAKNPRPNLPSIMPLIINARDIPDLVPAIAAVAAVSAGVTRITNIARLRLKESDRIVSTSTMLRALGAEITATDDEMVIVGKPQLSGGTVDSFNDHRIVMAATIAALAASAPTVITRAEAVNKSYPTFADDLRKLHIEIK